MTKHPPTKEHNYLRKIVDLGLTLTPKSLSEVDVQHDDWCDALAGRGFCNCDPDVSLRPRKGRDS